METTATGDKNGNGRHSSTRAPHSSSVCTKLEEEFHRQLGHARISGLSGPKGAEGGVVVELVEVADLIGAVHGSGTGALGREVGMVEDVEILGAELKLSSAP